MYVFDFEYTATGHSAVEVTSIKRDEKITPKQDRPDIYSNDDSTFESLRKSDRNKTKEIYTTLTLRPKDYCLTIQLLIGWIFDWNGIFCDWLLGVHFALQRRDSLKTHFSVIKCDRVSFCALRWRVLFEIITFWRIGDVNAGSYFLGIWYNDYKSEVYP